MELDHHLARLESAELVHRLDEEELAFIFKHVLLQNTAYESLLKNDRKRLHLLVGEILERVYPDQLTDLAPLLARHFTLAGERERAIRYSRLAAQREIARYAYDEAVQQLESALDLFEPDQSDETHLALLEETGDAYRLLRSAARTIALYQQALDVWNKLDHNPKQTGLRLHRKIIQTIADVKWSVGIDFMQKASQVRRASRAALESEIAAMHDSPNVETVEALAALSMDAWRIESPPDWDAAQRFADQAVKMAEQLDRPVVLSRALDALASVYDGRSRLREHLQIVLRRLAITQDPRFDDLREKIDALRGAGQAHMYVGEYRQALPHLTEAENLADSIQAYELLTFAMSIETQCQLRLDEWDEVLKIEQRWRDLERRYSRERVGAT
jgi:tetratricopeptide (TPR) repeat protein